MRWPDYLKQWTTGGRHNRFAEWTVSGVWEFTRSDGLKTAHKMESPFLSWRKTVEESMRLADERIPLGAALPVGMGSRDDPSYDPLWDWDRVPEPDHRKGNSL